jgi:hypothetical protein
VLEAARGLDEDKNTPAKELLLIKYTQLHLFLKNYSSRV